MSSLKQKAVSGIIWTFAQQFSVQVINFIVQVILARLLLPEDFGLIAMLTVFISIGQFLMDGGMTSSLIKTKNPNQMDYSTVFMTNMLISIFIYIIVFVSAPLIASFYQQYILSDILRVYAITFVIRALVAVHIAKLTKEMNFKTQMKLQIPSTIIGAFVGIVLAYQGYGVWSLVWLNLSQTIAFAVQNWIFLKWRPSFIFDKQKFKYHFNFGYKLTLSGLLHTVYTDSYRIIIGKFFSPAIVGYYNQAETMRLFPVRQLTSVIDKVTYPLFAQIKGDDGLKSAYKRIMKMAFFIIVPIMMILIVTGEEFFLMLFGEKWLPAVPYFKILAFASITTPLTRYNLNILKVKGRSDLFLRLEVIKKIIGVLGIAIAIPFGILSLVISQMIVTHLMALLNMFYCGRLINYSLKEQLIDCSGLYFVGLCCLGLTFIFRQALLKFDLSYFLIVLCSTVLFLAFYLLMVYFFDRKMIISIKEIRN